MFASTFVRRCRRTLLLAAMAMLCAACGQEGPKLHPVRGKVLFEGQPPKGATVVLRPVASRAPDGIFPRGAVKSDGIFTLECYELGAGAPEGEYVAVFMWYPAEEALAENPVNKLPARYADETTSGLTVTIKPGTNELSPFQLTR